MAFDWEHFLNSRNIHYVTSGSNVARGHIAVKCPFCGSDDPSEHMGISLKGKGWGCLRNQDHRGKAPTRLIQALLGCSWEQAAAIAGATTSLPEDFMSTVRDLVAPKGEVVRTGKLKIPEQFKSFKDYEAKPSARPYVRYLREERGFYEEEIGRLTRDYGVYYCTQGWFRHRVVFTIREMGELVSFTGRSIHKEEPQRYRTLPVDTGEDQKTDLPAALGPLPDYLLWHDMLAKSDADTLCLCEGPFDALKVAVLGEGMGVDATCFFTATPSQRQIALLHELAPRYKRRFLLLDRGTLATSLRLAGELRVLGIVPKEIPSTIKDPGDIGTRPMLRRILRS